MNRGAVLLLGAVTLLLALSCNGEQGVTPPVASSPTAAPTGAKSPTPTPLSSPTPSRQPTASALARATATIPRTAAPSATAFAPATQALPTAPATPVPSPSSAPSPTPPTADIYFAAAPDRDPFSLVQRLRPPADGTIPRVVNPVPVNYQSGRLDVFWVTDLVDQQMFQVEAELVRVSEHAYWYFEKGLPPSLQALDRAVETYEESIYPVVTGAFGREWVPGVDNDPHLTILHTRLQGAAGYFSASDEYSSLVYPFSNEREMIYMDWRGSQLGSIAYLGTLAHELQHAIHWAADNSEATWVNEGLSEVAKGLADYGFSFINYFMTSPSTSLTAWPSAPESTLPHYGAASLFMEYLSQEYGGRDTLDQLVAGAEDGIQGVSAYLGALGYAETFEDVFGDWLVANYLDPLGLIGYSYNELDVAVGVGTTLTEPGEFRGATAQYAGEYVELLLDEGDAEISFQGAVRTPLLPVEPRSGTNCWWSNRGDSIDSTLTRSFNLTAVSRATLNFWMWHAVEERWDYAYVEASTDGGSTWDVLQGSGSSPRNPLGLSFGAGYTGRSDGWIQETVDLSPYAGGRLLLRFEYVTDESVNEEGVCIDDISIPEIGYADDAEGPGEWAARGFIRTDNWVPQAYLVRLIELGDPVTIRDMPLDETGRGSLVVRGHGEDMRRVVVVVAPMAPKTTEPSSYVLTVAPVP